MVLSIRRFVTRIFGSDEIEQSFTVLSPQQTPEWEHYFPHRDRTPEQDEPTQREQPAREPALRAR